VKCLGADNHGSRVAGLPAVYALTQHLGLYVIDVRPFNELANREDDVLSRSRGSSNDRKTPQNNTLQDTSAQCHVIHKLNGHHSVLMQSSGVLWHTTVIGLLHTRMLQ